MRSADGGGLALARPKERPSGDLVRVVGWSLCFRVEAGEPSGMVAASLVLDVPDAGHDGGIFSGVFLSFSLLPLPLKRTINRKGRKAHFKTAKTKNFFSSQNLRH